MTLHDRPFTLPEVQPQIHAWARSAPTLGALDDWRFRCQADDAARYVTGWLTYAADERIHELEEDISYALVLNFANKFGSAQTVLDHWMIAMCEKAQVSVPLFPQRELRKFK